MKQFFKFMFASMLGFFLSLILVFVLLFVLIAGIVAFVGTTTTKTTVSSNSILHITLEQPVQERSSKNPLEGFDWGSFTPNPALGLNDILSGIKRAKNDDKIKGIFLELGAVPSEMATLEEIRNVLMDFKKTKKFIYAYSEVYTQGAYYIASAADKIYLNPQGIVDFRGFRAELLFFKNALEKLEIEPQIIRHGKFKSAVEPFMLEKMSDENRRQMATYINSLWEHYLKCIAVSRNIDVNDLKNIADKYLIQNAHDALKFKMVDVIAYKDIILSELKKATGIDENAQLKFIGLKKYAENSEEDIDFDKNKIAVIYATGEIETGRGNETTIGSDRLSETFRKARRDKKIKAIVLRINSPGGSALASDVIWREVDLTKKEKPVIVSMGDVAASGGYYIACAADTIVAQPNTLTGSIGVFGVLFNAKKLFNNKLGITVDTVKTGTFADIGSMTRPLTSAEREIVQKSVETVYDTFITRVAEGRHISIATVDSIGQGRIWSGTDAKKIKLVDVLGGIDTAIAIAAKKAKLTGYRIVSLPEQEEPVQQIINQFTDNGEDALVKNRLGQEAYNYYRQFRLLLKTQGVQARMTFHIQLY